MNSSKSESMNPFKVHRNWNVTYQYGLDGIKRETNVSNALIFIAVVIFLSLFILSSLYLFSLQNWNQTKQALAKVQKENILLRQKLDYYSEVIDSIYQKLDTLKLSSDPGSPADRYYPYFRNEKGDRIEDNTFVYDAYLDARVNSTEQQIRKIATGLNWENKASGSIATVASTDIIRLDNGPSIFPTFGKWQDGWGTRLHPFYNRFAFHYGVDISNKMGTPIYATSDGEVSFMGYDTEYGKLIKIKHNNNFETRYGHLYNFMVVEGDKVRKGQIIAMMGSTGMSTGPHLHYEVLVNGAKVNPAYYLNRIDEAVYYAQQ
jgi:murein DD-endopeptidase MepM/ murein hydrolase activator NlpD